MFSGGHINPAVTFAFFLAQKISFMRGILYIIVQVTHSLCQLMSIDHAFHNDASSGVECPYQVVCVCVCVCVCVSKQLQTAASSCNLQ